VDYSSLLAVELELSEFGSRLTVLDGRNGAPFITDAMFAVDVDRNFTRSEYEARKFLTFYQVLLIFSPPTNPP